MDSLIVFIMTSNFFTWLLIAYLIVFIKNNWSR